jgi:hypothetical protein
MYTLIHRDKHSSARRGQLQTALDFHGVFVSMKEQKQLTTKQQKNGRVFNFGR